MSKTKSYLRFLFSGRELKQRCRKHSIETQKACIVLVDIKYPAVVGCSHTAKNKHAAGLRREYRNEPISGTLKKFEWFDWFWGICPSQQLQLSGQRRVARSVCLKCFHYFGNSDSNGSIRQCKQMQQLPRPQPLKLSSTLLLLFMLSPQQAGKAGGVMCVAF